MRTEKSEVEYEIPITDNGWIEAHKKALPKHRWVSVIGHGTYSGEFVTIEVGIDVERNVLMINIKKEKEE